MPLNRTREDYTKSNPPEEVDWLKIYLDILRALDRIADAINNQGPD